MYISNSKSIIYLFIFIFLFIYFILTIYFYFLVFVFCSVCWTLFIVQALSIYRSANTLILGILSPWQ